MRLARLEEEFRHQLLPWLEEGERDTGPIQHSEDPGQQCDPAAIAAFTKSEGPGERRKLDGGTYRAALDVGRELNRTYHRSSIPSMEVELVQRWA